ncbi:hypothetical protein DL762_005121 [Monosporascus cannonballus]|uniref:Mannan endo-1,6-alpha-mannosidase n=1 Tax=Monosporascus cannonballus TaxID=155416 RepID=A0ABY0H5Q1_9PEZI|nr:hypothetical protein DL762_005121 [Monosporascus cannonballus]
MWVEGICMADSFYAKWAALYDKNNQTAWNNILLQYKFIQNAKLSSSLLLHRRVDGTACWADSGTGRAPDVWDRALGWYFDITRNLTRVLKNARDPASGSRWQVVEPQYAGSKGNFLQSSSSVMFTLVTNFLNFGKEGTPIYNSTLAECNLLDKT